MTDQPAELPQQATIKPNDPTLQAETAKSETTSPPQENTMAFPTAVNDQITDAVTQSNIKVLGDAPAMALGSLYQTHSNAVGVLMQNAVAQQQNAAILANATITSCINSLNSSHSA